MRVDPAVDRIAVDGDRVPIDSTKRYVIFNKPAGFITTRRDPEGRQTVFDLIDVAERVFPVGRLDAQTEGLLLLTNDGDLAHRLAHPSYGVEKVYLADVEGHWDPIHSKRLIEEGVRIDSGRKARATKVRVRGSTGARTPKSLVEIGIHEGRKHVVRRMLEASGYPVRRLTRIAFGPLRLGRLGPGRYRDLTASEVASLYRAVGL